MLAKRRVFPSFFFSRFSILNLWRRDHSGPTVSNAERNLTRGKGGARAVRLGAWIPVLLKDNIATRVSRI